MQGQSQEKGGYYGNSLLYEVQEEGRYQECEADHTEEWQTGYGGCLSQLWDESIQDRESLGIPQPLVVEGQGIGPALL